MVGSTRLATIFTAAAVAFSLTAAASAQAPALSEDSGLQAARTKAAAMDAVQPQSGAQQKDVFVGERTFIQGWTSYYNADCSLADAGAHSVTSAPKHGALAFALEERPALSGPCAGKKFLSSVVYYTWTDKSSPAATDQFGLHWQTGDGGFSDDTSWTVSRAPRIFWAGNDVTETVQQVVAGQKIDLSFSPAAKSNSWKVNGASNGGYTPTPSAPQNPRVLPVETSKPKLEVFLLGPNRQKITLKVKTPQGNDAEADVTFDAAAPKPVSATAKLGAVIVVPPNGIFFGDLANGKPGISFSAAGTKTPGPGDFYWVQVVAGDSRQVTDAKGKKFDCSFQSGLDNTYPYDASVTTNDSPGSRNGYDRMKLRTDFTMYLMWLSSTAGAVPVPLGHFDWRVGWNANRDPHTGYWNLLSKSKSVTNFKKSRDYPIWARVLTNGAPKCKPIK